MTTGDGDSSNPNVDEAPRSAPLTREALYALVWSEPMLKVGIRYGVSSSYMAGVCAFLKVPRPERGYWAKLAVGKAPPVPPLPDAQPGDDLVWSRDGQRIRVERQLPRPPSSVRRKPHKSSMPLPTEHPLIVGAKAHFEAGRLPYDSFYLKPANRLLVDLAVTKTGLDKALAFANRLFLAFEGRGYRVVIAPDGEHFSREEIDEHEVQQKKRGYNNLWAPQRGTVAYIGTVAIGLTVIEMSEGVEVRYVNGKYVRETDYIPPKRGRGLYDHTWTTTKDFPTGRLRLQAYSPYHVAKWVKTWQETKGRDLDSQIKIIVKELDQATVDIARLVEEGERKAAPELQRWEAEREKWRKEEAERRRVQALKESRAELREIIARWVESNHIERCLQDIELKVADLNDSEKLEVLKRLKIARELLVSTDALDHFMNWKSPDER